MRFVLTDLDELAASVRDRVSRSYVEEAIASYRAHAFRAAVVSTWTAVAFDIISKLRELAAQGDGAATQMVEMFNRATENQAIDHQLRLERTLLDDAKDRFGLLTSAEFDDLANLRRDRHRCAHPAFDGDELFQPSPEQVRAHIVHGVSHLLSQPPMQGKAALKRVLADLLQPSFPADQSRATSFLRSKYLDRAKDALIRSILSVCMKIIIRHSESEFVGHEDAIVRCVIAVKNTHPLLYGEKIAEMLPKMCDGLDDVELQRVFALLAKDPGAWNWLDEPTQTRLAELVRVQDFENPDDAIVANALSIAELRDSALAAIERADSWIQERIVAQCPRVELREIAIRVYGDAGSWRHAERLGENVLLPMAEFLEPEDIATILSTIEGNGQIWDASGSPAIIARFFDAVERHHDATGSNWQTFFSFIRGMRRSSSFSTLEQRMISKGMLPPAEDSLERTDNSTGNRDDE